MAISISYAAIITTESSFSFEQDAASSEQRSRASDGGLPPIFQVISMFAVIACGLVVHGGCLLAARLGFFSWDAGAAANGLHAAADVGDPADRPPLAHELSAEVRRRFVQDPRVGRRSACCWTCGCAK